MGDRPHLKLVHPSTRRKGVLHYKVPKHGNKPEYPASGRPTDWDEFEAFFEAWYAEQREWMRWVQTDIEEIEVKLGAKLAPPPPPDDPW